MDKTRKSTSSKICPDSTCAISVRRKGQILLVVDFLVLSTAIAALISSAGYYSAPIFTRRGVLENSVLLRLEEEYWRSPFFNQFYWSDF